MAIRFWSLGDLAWLKELVIAGLTEEQIAVEMTESRAEIRAAVAVMGLTAQESKDKHWCDLCGSWRTQFDHKTGWCRLCSARLRLEAQLQSDDEEERRLLEVLLREANRIKKQRQRMRETYGVNPRKGRGTDSSGADGGEPAAPQGGREPGEGLCLHDAEGVTPTHD